jgi:multiple sugar transport system ATP-binding protein
MNGGRIEQVGAPNHLYHSPATRFVAGFIGSPAMNFLPCTLEGSANALQVRVNGDIAFPVPQERVERYRAHQAKTNLVFGLRPEHLTEARSHVEPNQHAFDVVLEVTEPMGMETLVHFRVNGSDVCGRVNPAAKAQAGQSMKLMADLNHMHLIDGESGKVL